MAAWRRAIELSLGDADTAKLRSIAQSRTEPASRVERARILLAYREDPSFFAVGRALGSASSDRPALRRARRGRRPAGCARRSPSPRQGTDDHAGGQGMAGVAGVPEGEGPWLSPRTVDDRLLARHAREHGPAEGHACLANLAQGTCGRSWTRRGEAAESAYTTWNSAILTLLKRWRSAVRLSPGEILSRPQRVEEEAERCDGDHLLRREARIQAIARRLRICRPNRRACDFAREHEYKRHGTVSLLAGIDLVTGKVQRWSRIASQPRIHRIPQASRRRLSGRTAIKLILDNFAHISREKSPISCAA